MYPKTIQLLNGSLGSLGAATIQLKDYIGKYFKVNKDIPKWSKPPGQIFPLVNNQSIVKMGDAVGTILNIEKGSDGKYWAETSRGGWFNFNAYAPALVEHKLDDLTEAQKAEVIKNVIRATAAAVPGGELTVKVGETAYDVGKGVVETGATVLDSAAWLGRNLKTILIVSVAGVASFYGYKAYTAVNKLKSENKN